MVKILNAVPTSGLWLLVSEAGILFGCYIAGAFLAQRFFEGPDFAANFLFGHGLLKISLVVAAIMLGLNFSYLRENNRIDAPIQSIQRVCLGVGIAFLAQAFIGFLTLDWIVPRYVMILGSAIVVVVIPPWRMLYASLSPKK